jgi:hypothetical protein
VPFGLASDLDSITIDGPIYRVGRAPDPWSWPGWTHARPDGTFGNRWDDPRGVYRVLYASSQRVGAYLEALQVHRPDFAVAAERIEEDADDEGHDMRTLAPGQLDSGWIESTLMLGEARTDGVFADVGTARSLAGLRRDFLARARDLGLDELDGGAIRLKAPRELTQEISRHVYESSDDYGARVFNGVQYQSTLGDEYDNWAIFEPTSPAMVQLSDEQSSPVNPDDRDLQTALEILEIRLV